MQFVQTISFANFTRLILFLGIATATFSLGCSGSTTAATTATAASTTSVYPAAYQAARWTANTTVSFPSTCSMTYTTTGVPVVHDTYYLAPAANGQTVVATTPISKMSMALINYSASSLKGNTATVNICPTAATASTPTGFGAIGFLISGIALFNAYEATGQVALSDNVSYTFKDSNGVAQTASFLDGCSSHQAGGATGATWHYHGLPICVTSTIDSSTGPSHLLGFALDGYPIYGGRDITGTVITTSQLDACNGITSPTPEFATATYHYVLPIGVTGAQSSIGCYHGTVNAKVAAAARKLACNMPGMAMGM